MEILRCEKRVKDSLHSAKRERRKGLVPGILYGSEIGNMLFEIGELELNKEISRLGEHGAVNLEINNESHKALIKEIQKDPVTQKIVHIDLQEINENKIIQTEVPLIFSGEISSSNGGGIVQKEKNNIRVQGKYNKIPKSITVDVSNMRIGDVYRISDLEISNEISFIEDPSTVVAVVSRASTTGDASDNNLNSSINSTTDKKPPVEKK
ncbi:50S ribosomal protein L25 [Clostridium bovifaecis]|uniref:Large ribosomal subunit protein bL25 n=1 Tax=Clostridium bovifaecis TaxID=2184719 RepID=A0A6I6EMU6_9CLOT|nr:50S ribosomal protein L25 [Clostridium bovifaecis]